MSIFLQDVRIGMRNLLRRPAFTVTALAVLALGIAATSSIFSVVNGVLLKPLPFPHPERLGLLNTTNVDGGLDTWSGANYLDLAAQSTSYETVAGFRAFQFNLDDGEFPGSHRGLCVTNTFFRVLGVDAAIGRTLSPEADPPEGERTVVISHGLWQSRFGGDPAALGRSMELNGTPHTIVGIMPPWFDYTEGMELWFRSSYRVPDPPFDFGANPEGIRAADYFNVIARLKPGVSFAQAQQEGSAIASRLAEQYPDSNRDEGFRIRPLHEVLVQNVHPALTVLFGAGGFVLLIACVNVASLLLVRVKGREQEIAIRRALGEDRIRLARRLLIESGLLGLMGGAAGLALSIWGTDALVALASADLPRAGEVKTDTTVLLFTLLLSVGSGLLFGLIPALQAGRSEPAAILSEGGARHGAGPARSRLMGMLVAAEIAISLVLLVGAGLMIRTLASLNTTNPGFAARDVLTARVFVPANKYAEDSQVRQFYRQVIERVRALPGVRSAAGVMSLPVSHGVDADLSFIIEGRPTETGANPVSGYQTATDGYFETIGLPVLRGRSFAADDRDGSLPVAVVSKAFADKFFPGEDPVGKHISWNDDANAEDFRWVTIVGVVGNSLHYGLDGAPRAEAYQPFDQAPWPFMSLVIAGDGQPASLAPALRRAVMEVDPLQPVTHIRTLSEILHGSLGRRRFNMVLMSIFAGMALLLAAVGLYGVLSYVVAQRRREIGIRMALGADAARVAGHILQEGARPVLLGAGIGFLGSLALSRLIAGLVHGIPALDPVSFACAVLVLVAACLLAVWLPARRAAGMDPITTLRSE